MWHCYLKCYLLMLLAYYLAYWFTITKHSVDFRVPGCDTFPPFSFHSSKDQADPLLSSLLPRSSLHQTKLNSLSFHNQAPPMRSPPRALSLDTIFIKFHAWPPLPSLKSSRLDHLKVRCLFHLLDYPRSGPRDLVSQHAKLDSYPFLVS